MLHRTFGDGSVGVALLGVEKGADRQELAVPWHCREGGSSEGLPVKHKGDEAEYPLRLERKPGCRVYNVGLSNNWSSLNFRAIPRSYNEEERIDGVKKEWGVAIFAYQSLCVRQQALSRLDCQTVSYRCCVATRQAHG